jgi:hypothetical protein
VHVAVLGFEAPSEKAGDYLAEELWEGLQDAGRFVLVDRRNLDKVEAEMVYQVSGAVSDESGRSIGQQVGAGILVYGRLSPLGAGSESGGSLGREYRLTVYATDVEKATSGVRTAAVRPDSRLNGLLEVGLDEAIDRAVAALGKGLSSRLAVGIGRISYNGTGTVSSLSAYLKQRIVGSAAGLAGKFTVVSDEQSAAFAVSLGGLTEGGATDSPVEALIAGSFSPLGADAEVQLYLARTTGALLGSAKFTISRADLAVRNLSLLPPKEGTVISAAEFSAKQQAIAPYDGKHNAFKFSIAPDSLDGVYHEGDYMTLRVYGERDCYFRLLQVDVEGNVQVIYPRSARDNNFLRAGEIRRIPDNTRFRLGRPFGEEYILAAAYGRPPEGDAGGRLSGEMIRRGLYVEDNEPLAAARFGYTILGK